MYREAMYGGILRRGDYRTLTFAGALALFVLSWPLDRRHLLFTDYSFITGSYTEAGTLSLYASDLAFVVLWVAWLWYATRSTEISLPRRAVWLGFAFVVWAAFRALPLPTLGIPEFSLPLSWYGAARIAQGFLFAIIIAQAWPSPLLRRVLLGTLVVSGLFQGLLGIGQTLQGRDFGLRFLGEHPLSLETPGVAKVDIRTYKYQSGYVPRGTFLEDTKNEVQNDVPIGTKVLRAYGTFPHPNVLGAFLLSSLFAAQLLFKNDRGTLGTYWLYPVSFVLSSGILATFSRSVWISTLLFLGTLAACSYGNAKDRRRVLLFSLSVAFGLLLPLLFPLVRSATIARFLPGPTDAFIQGRFISFHDTLYILARRLLIGAGTGNGFIELVRVAGNFDINNKYVLLNHREPWEYQYPHNVFLVLLLELGIVGLLLFLAFLYESMRLLARSARIRAAFARVPLTGVVFAILAIAVLGFTDHYLWTIQQGRLLFWGIIGILLSVASRASADAADFSLPSDSSA